MSSKSPAALAKVEPERLNQLAATCQKAVALAKANVAETFALAAVVQDLRAAVAPLVPAIRPLVGTSIGFRTDRDTSDKGPYGDSVLADVIVEAIARGLRLTGNEFNVIGSKLYVTKEGYSRLVSELDGLTDLELTPSVPRMGDGGAVVKYRATWKIDGKPFTLEREIPTRLNAGMGSDAAVGKATRKMLASIHARVTGSAHSFADSDAEDVEAPKEAKGDALAARLAAARKAAEETVGKVNVPPDHIPGVGDPALDQGALFGNATGKPHE